MSIRALTDIIVAQEALDADHPLEHEMRIIAVQAFEQAKALADGFLHLAIEEQLDVMDALRRSFAHRCTRGMLPNRVSQSSKRMVQT